MQVFESFANAWAHILVDLLIFYLEDYPIKNNSNIEPNYGKLCTNIPSYMSLIYYNIIFLPINWNNITKELLYKWFVSLVTVDN